MADPKITNEMRPWYIMFVLWCMENSLDYQEHDFNELKLLDSVEYYELQKKAYFKILSSDKCPVCWGHVGPEKRRSLPVVCDCGVAFDVDVKKLHAWRHEE